jgi:acyl-CoA hydrolase
MTTEIDLHNLDFARLIRPGDQIVWGQGSGEPVSLVERLVEQRHAVGPVGVFLGGTCYSDTLRPEHADAIKFTGFGAIGSLRRLAAAGALQIIPCHLSQLAGYFVDGIIRCDVLFLHLSGPNEDGQLSYSLANDYLQFAMARARVVIAEVNEMAPWTYFDGRLDRSRIDCIVKVSRPVMELAPASFGAVEKAIAAHIGGFIEDGTTIQMGIGAIPDAVLAGVTDRRDLGIHSGLIGDRVADLMERGIVTNARKPIDTGFTTAGTLRGTRRLYDFARRNHAIRLFTLMHTHRAEILSQLDKVIAVNSAVEVDLTGQVNAEVAGGVQIGAVGGQGDFVRGVQMAARGRSIIALPATARDGQLSRIVARLGGPVTTARSDADLIITEFGVADLKGQPLGARIPRMIAISDPRFREELEREAHQMMRRGAPSPG